MKLSVIVSTRNRAHAIVGCLDSIAASLAKAAPLDAEIVVVDNGSQDATSRIVEQ
jgi:glycosyltransferase involved in cell wall biosynthesis